MIEIKPQLHWMLRLRGPSGRKGLNWHFATSDETGRPRNKTVCGRRYDPGDRIAASKGVRDLLTSRVCSKCLAPLGDLHAEIRRLALLGGGSEQEAISIADGVLKWR